MELYTASFNVPLTNGKVRQRRIWQIDILTWVRYFHAMNVAGHTHISSEALGAPLRLKFRKDGTPSTSTVKELSQAVAVNRENYTTLLKADTSRVEDEMADEFAMSLEAAREAAKPIFVTEQKALVDYEASRQPVAA